MNNFLRKHLGLIVSIILCLIMVGAGRGYVSVANSERNSLLNDIADVQNNIDKMNSSLLDTTYKIKKSATGLDVERQSKDDSIMLKWITPAFEFNDGNEYNENRKIFIERLGEKDVFVTRIMPAFVPMFYVNESDPDKIPEAESKAIAAFNMHIKKNGGFKSWVESINDTTYSYIAFIETESTNSMGYSGSSTVILGYSIDKDGNISNFRAWTPDLTN